MRAAAVLFASLAAPAVAQPPAIPPAATGPAKIDGPLKVAPHRLVRLSVTAEPNETFYWRVRPGKDVDFAAGQDGPGVVFAAPPGRYSVEVFIVGVRDGKPTFRTDEAEVVVGDPAPPKPPEPPKVNPYRERLKAAYDADDMAEGKAEARALLAELYRQAVALAADEAVATTDVLRERLRRATATLAADRLVGVRTAIAEILAPALPLGQPMTADRRAVAGLLFAQIAEAMTW